MNANAEPIRVGVLTPMPSEMHPVAKAMHLDRAQGDGYRRGRVGIAYITAGRTGMGTKLAREATERLLDANDLDHVVVVGIAGGMGTAKVLDVMYPAVVVDKDSGTRYTSTPLGGIVTSGLLVTHDDFDMQPDEHKRLVDDGFTAVDMETAAIAAVCEARGVPWFAVRSISDLVGVTPGDVIGLANPDGSPKIGAGLKYLVTKPQRIPKLVRLARESMGAARAAADAAATALRTAGPERRNLT